MNFSKFLIILFLIAFCFKGFGQACGFNENTFRAGGTFSGDCELDVGGSITVTGDIIITSGRITINDSGGGGDGDMFVNSGGSITIRDGASLDLDDGDVTVNSGGSITVDDGGILEILDNDDRTLTVDGGTLTMNGDLSVRDDFIVEGGGTVTFGPTATADLQDDLIIEGGSNVLIEAGAVILVDEELDLDDSNLTIFGTITSNDEDNFNISDGSTLTINDPAVVEFGDLEFEGGDGSTVIVNGGTLTLTSEVDLNGEDDDQIIVNDGGTVIVESDLEIGNAESIITVNSGGSFSAPSIDGVVYDDPDDLPDNIDLQGGDFNIGGNPLPVELISFKADLIENDQTIQLKWATASEINNEGFHVQRSINGIDWVALGFVAGNGTTSDLNEYSFLDFGMRVSSYFRLRQVDYDGQFEYSPLLYVSLVHSSIDAINIYPNPTHSYITLDGLQSEIYDVQVVDMTGKIILNSRNINLTQSEMLINNLLRNKLAGIYLLKFSNPGHSEVIRLIKK